MPLTNKSINIRDEVWRHLRINAELAGVSVRDYLTYVILTSQSIADMDEESQRLLASIVQSNLDARQTEICTVGKTHTSIASTVS